VSSGRHFIAQWATDPHPEKDPDLLSPCTNCASFPTEELALFAGRYHADQGPLPGCWRVQGYRWKVSRSTWSGPERIKVGEPIVGPNWIEEAYK